MDKVIANTDNEVTYNFKKDFYTGVQGELRLKAEGLFKKAKEKGISIEDIQVMTLKENRTRFPGLGVVELPTFIAKVKGKVLKTGQIMTDAKQIDYYNRYQKYVAEKIKKKNSTKSSTPKLHLDEWEMFEVGKALIDDKEFGLEKTITGACDRVIRKLMGENDWIYSGEAKLLDEEFFNVQRKVKSQQKQAFTNEKQASEKQINFLKSKINKTGLDANNSEIISQILNEMGYNKTNMNELTISEMSKVIDSVYKVIPVIKERLNKTIH